MADIDDQETCPLCPSSGPPVYKPKETEAVTTAADAPSAPTADADADDEDISWISCSKCSTWYHGVCLLVSGDDHKSTVPETVLAYVAEQPRAEWTNWTGWVGRWFCHGCIAQSIDPTNPHRPHHPLAATIDNRAFPPKPKQPRKSAKRASIQPDEASSPAESSSKRRRIDTEERSKLSSESSAQPQDQVVNGSASQAPDGEKANGSARPKRQAALNRPDYHALHHHIATPTARWLDLIRDPEKYGTTIKPANIPRIPSTLMTRAWLDGLEPSEYPPTLYYGPEREPLVFRPEDGGFEGLGGKIPGPDLTVADVARLVGPNRMVDVIDVATQSSEQWTLEKWAGYVAAKFGSNTASASASNPDPTTSKVFNVISLEISGSKLAEQVTPPTLVSEIDWVDNCWNFGPGGKAAAMKEEFAKQNAEEAKEVKELKEVKEKNGNGTANGTNGKKEPRIKAREPWPKVQLYCLMGAKGSWTDWHVDFAASSVYYTIHTGAKTFFIIRPTAKNLAAYAEWSGSYEKQQTVWLGDMCDEVRKVELKQGDTMMLPAGYIHSVYTPEDSIVFGGNFLHSYDIPTQLRLRQIEIDTKVPQRFRFPFFDRLCWYVAERYCAHLRLLRQYRPRATVAPPPALPDRVMHGMVALANFLIDQCDIMENTETEDKRRKLIYDRIPDLVKDGPALARELKWRVERELPKVEVEQAVSVKAEDGAAKKDKAVRSKRPTSVVPQKGASRAWNVNLPSWEEHLEPIRQSTSTKSLAKPGEMEQAEAEEITTVRKQTRTRTRTLDDGTVVVEEQEIAFSEKIVLWAPPAGEASRVKDEPGGVVVGAEHATACVD